MERNMQNVSKSKSAGPFNFQPKLTAETRTLNSTLTKSYEYFQFSISNSPAIFFLKLCLSKTRKHLFVTFDVNFR